MKYLIPFDFSPMSKNALKHALRLAKVDGGDLFLLHIVNDRQLIRKNEILLRDFVSTLNHEKDTHVSFNVVVGDIFNDIGKIADYHGADLIVMGTHGVDAMQKFFGSNAIKIIRSATVPIIVIQEESDYRELNKIVMPISIEKQSMQVLRVATQLSKKYNAEIHLVGRKHDDEFLKNKENANVILAKRHLLENNVKHHFEIIEVSKSKFPETFLEYAKNNSADIIATTYYSDSLMPMFEKFVQNLIVNDGHIPVLCLNAQSLSKINSTLSFMTV
jgi:nucleotide-binding universal stress UspA family protein